jgi:adenylate cyclase
VQDLLRALAATIARAQAAKIRRAGAGTGPRREKPAARFTICVLPFANMSGDQEAGVLQRRHHRGHHHRPEQGLGARGGLAQQRLHVQGQHVDVPKVARELKVSHVLEGSVRKAGGRCASARS